MLVEHAIAQAIFPCLPKLATAIATGAVTQFGRFVHQLLGYFTLNPTILIRPSYRHRQNMFGWWLFELLRSHECRLCRHNQLLKGTSCPNHLSEQGRGSRQNRICKNGNVCNCPQGHCRIEVCRHLNAVIKSRFPGHRRNRCWSGTAFYAGFGIFIIACRFAVEPVT